MTPARQYGYTGDAFLTQSVVRQSDITQCAVRELSEPIQPGDAVPLFYLKQYTFPYAPFFTVSLSGTAWSVVEQMPAWGNRSLTIEGPMDLSGAPNACFRLARESYEVDGEIDILSFSPREGPCRLAIRWFAQSPLQIAKTTDDFDGDYVVFITR